MDDLKTFRIKHNLTQTDLARLIGVSMTCLQLWERGSMKPSKLNEIKIKQIMEELNGRHKVAIRKD